MRAFRRITKSCKATLLVILTFHVRDVSWWSVFPRCILPLQPTTNQRIQQGKIMDTYDLCRGAVAPEAAQRLLVTWREIIWEFPVVHSPVDTGWLIFSYIFGRSSCLKLAVRPWKSMVWSSIFLLGMAYVHWLGCFQGVSPSSSWPTSLFSTDSNPSLYFHPLSSVMSRWWFEFCSMFTPQFGTIVSTSKEQTDGLKPPTVYCICNKWLMVREC